MPQLRLGAAKERKKERINKPNNCHRLSVKKKKKLRYSEKKKIQKQPSFKTAPEYLPTKSTPLSFFSNGTYAETFLVNPYTRNCSFLQSPTALSLQPFLPARKPVRVHKWTHTELLNTHIELSQIQYCPLEEVPNSLRKPHTWISYNVSPSPNSA